MTCDRFAVSRNCCDDAPPENWHIWDNIFWSHTGGAQNSPNPHVVRSPALSHPFDMDYQSGHIYYTEGDRQGLFRTDAPNDAGQWCDSYISNTALTNFYRSFLMPPAGDVLRPTLRKSPDRLPARSRW